jgi:regulatory protein
MPDALRAKALALLARRDFSRAALAKRLMPLAESAEALEHVLDGLAARQQQSDARYAENRVGARGRRYGNRRLARELREEGVSDEMIAAALNQGGDETPRCREVWQKKFGVLPHDAAERMRQQRFLHYRGFSPEAIRQVLQGLADDE